MPGEREIEEETRNQMMQNLFGDQSEEEDEEEEEEGSDPADSDSNSDPNRPPHPSDYPSEGEGEVDAEGQGEVEIESEADVDPEKEGREGDGRVESEEEEEDEEEQDEFGERVATSRRREVFASESEEERSRSERNVFVAENDDDDEEEEIEQERKTRLPSAEQDNAVVRDVFGDSDEDEPANYDAQNELEQDIDVSPLRDGKVEYLPPEDLLDDRDQYESQDENLEHKRKEKPVGPPLDLEIPIRRPPSQPDKMNMIRVSNIMGIEPKPFDPKTYVEEDVFVTDESGANKRIRLEDNIVRWRSIRNRDGTISRESNARFVRWSDGSLQLLIGNEVLDITVQEAQHDHTHLFLRHDKGILQSQGRLLHKMKFMPSSLSSKSHRLLTALVDSRHKKVYKVKNCITDVDPEKEKEERERVEGQSNRANQLLQRKREKVNKKYTASADRGRHLSAGFLEEQIDEDDVPGDHYSYHRTAARRRFEEDMEIESRAERRIINAKRASVPKGPSRKPSSVLSRRPVGDLSESEREESEYETDGEEDDSPRPGGSGFNYDDEYGEEQPDVEVEPEEADAASEDDDEEPRQRRNVGGSRKGKEIESDEESPPRKTANHRRMAVVFDSDEE